jgi:dTDP-4-dehydrorhamnose reductase
MTDARILITGGSGQVGDALTRALAPLGKLYAPGRSKLDLADVDSIRTLMREIEPRWVVNAGAHTAVDKAESEPELAFAINARAPEVFAEEAKRVGGALIHFSTDYVFDGAKQTPYVETDATGPINVYGKSKLAGEHALAASGCAHFVFRTSWVYGATGKNFLLSILRLAHERDHLRIVSDQHGAPTWSDDLARMTAHVIGGREAVVKEDGCFLAEAVQSVGGIYHATGSGETTWYGFAAQAIEELRGAEAGVKLASLEAITTGEYPTPARRPLNSRLDCGKLERTLGWRMPEWQDSLALVVASLQQETASRR